MSLCYEFILVQTVCVRVRVFTHVGTVASAMWTQPIAARLNKSLKWGLSPALIIDTDLFLALV